jgi:hypothetical protein
MEPSKNQVAEKLRDGSTIIIRAIHPDARERLRTHLSDFQKVPIRWASRFMAASDRLARVKQIQMTDVDFVDHVALAATFSTDPGQTLIGVGRYIVCANDPKRHRAEIAFAVLDEHQGKGIAHCCCSILG